MRSRPIAVVNRVLARANLELTPVRTTVWDRYFKKWVADAKASGRDPNDVGDIEWENDALADGLRDFYLPRATSESIVVELGPGSGRLTRHLVGRVRQLTVVDYSPAVTKWLTGYLAGRGPHEVKLISRPGLPWIASQSVDVAFAHGVVEHFDQEVLVAFLADLERVLRPGGEFVFTFNDLSSGEAKAYLIREGGDVKPNRFRFYEPAAVERLGRMFGFDVELSVTGERISFAVFRKAPPPILAT